MAAITPEEALAYLRRWELVREAEARELRRTPMETKLRQLAALMARVMSLGRPPIARRRSNSCASDGLVCGGQ